MKPSQNQSLWSNEKHKSLVTLDICVACCNEIFDETNSKIWGQKKPQNACYTINEICILSINL